jgi:outer membrane protein assembly factor BamB
VLRTGGQLNNSAACDSEQVQSLHIGWDFQPADGRAFRSSPIVYKNRVYIGNANGRLYALNASTGALLWQHPPAGSPPLTSQFTCNPSSLGIASSPAIASIGGTDAVIFGAPDQSFGSGLGEGRLFALNAATGAVIWKSPVVARLTGTTSRSTAQFHEQIGYSAPLIFNNRVYVGVANHCDNPIQRGRVVAVHLATGAIDGAFTFEATQPAGTRGGGVWSSVSGWLGGLYVTTGNTRFGSQPEPPVNHGLSLMRLDAGTGSVVWKLQPVPFALDGDPDWASGANVLLASCGTRIVSTMKDGWTYAVNAGTGVPGPPSVAWQFPPTGFPFTPGEGTTHGDIRYLRPGAAWEDVFVTMTGGYAVTTDVTGGYRRLHGLNVCAANTDRVRWLLDVPGASGTYALGPPTVCRGVFYVGTSSGRLIAFADPGIYPAAGFRCNHPDVPAAACFANGFRLVPEPAVLADVQLQGAIMTEPAISNGRVFVATGFFNDVGTLYMLEP